MIEKILEKLEDYKYSHLVEHDSERIEHCKEQEGHCEGSDCFLCIWDKAISIVQEVAKEYGKDTNVPSNGWIPYTTNGELPNNGQRVWLSFTTPYTSFVKSSWWIYDHFEWENGKTVKDYPLAWKPYEVPAPYQKGE